MYKKLIKILLLVNLNNNINSMIYEKYNQFKYSKEKTNKIKITDPLKELIEKFKMPIENQTIGEIIGLLNTRLNNLTEEDFRIGLFSEEDFINVFTMFSKTYRSNKINSKLYEFFIKYQEKNFLEFQKLKSLMSEDYLYEEYNNKVYTIIYNDEKNLLKILDEKLSLVEKTKILDDILFDFQLQNLQNSKDHLFASLPRDCIEELLFLIKNDENFKKATEEMFQKIINVAQIYERKDFESMEIIKNMYGNKYDPDSLNNLADQIEQIKAKKKDFVETCEYKEYLEHLIKHIISSRFNEKDFVEPSKFKECIEYFTKHIIISMQFEIYEMCKLKEIENEKIKHIKIEVYQCSKEDYSKYIKTMYKEIQKLTKQLQIIYRNIEEITFYIQ